MCALPTAFPIACSKRSLNSMAIANSGSVGLPYDGDQRAAYVLVDNEIPTIRRVEYDVESEIKQLAASGIPHAAWTAKMLRTASPQVP